MKITRTPGKQERRYEVHERGKNRILTLLKAQGEGQVVSTMERVSLKQKDFVSRRHEPISHVYFPLSGVLSFIIELEEGPSVEVGTVGNEGMSGASLLLGVNQASTDAFAQIPGDFMRMPAEALVFELGKNGIFADITRRTAQGFFSQVAQSAACGRAHPVEQRLARWILMSQDRAGTDSLQLTQEFLALMLGVLRPSVTVAASALQKAGLIRYRRGVIDVIDRRALEQTSCECYQTVRQEYERLLH